MRKAWELSKDFKEKREEDFEKIREIFSKFKGMENELDKIIKHSDSYVVQDICMGMKRKLNAVTDNSKQKIKRAKEVEEVKEE